MLLTPRLMVRQLTMDDLEAVHDVWSDPDVIFWGEMRDIDASRAMLEQVLKRRLDRPARRAGWFGVFRIHDMRFVGDVVLEPARGTAIS